MSNDTSGPAFPVPEQSHYGLSLRDYFAAKALQGLLANPGGPIQRHEMHGWGFTNCNPDNVAATAYGMADAMLAARGGGKS